MARLPKCKLCGKLIEDKSNAIKKSNGWYHNDCFEKYRKKVAPKCKECRKPIIDKEKDGIKKNGYYYCNDCYERIEKKSEEYKRLISYIHNILAGNVSTGIYKQISKYESKGMTYNGMLLTLRYLSEIKKITFTPDNGMGLIELTYEEANKKYKSIENLEKELNLFNDKEELLRYLDELYEHEIPKIVYKQLDDFIDKYGMKYKGILLTLSYAFKELEIPFDKEKGIGICLYKYNEAKNEYLRQQEINKAIEEFEFEEKEVVVNKKIDNKQWSKVKEINMEDEETIYG